MSVARVSAAAALLPDGSVLIVGGNSTSTEAEVFNPSTSQFASGGNFSPAGLGVAAASLQ